MIILQQQQHDMHVLDDHDDHDKGMQNENFDEFAFAFNLRFCSRNQPDCDR